MDRASARADLGRALAGFGHDAKAQLALTQARTEFAHALTLAIRSRDEVVAGKALLGLGDLDVLDGRFQLATERFERALQILRAAGDDLGCARAIVRLGRLAARTGHSQQAGRHFEEAVRLGERITGDVVKVQALIGLADARAAWGDRAEARSVYRQALALTLGPSPQRAEIVLGLGRLEAREDRLSLARGLYLEALRTAERSDSHGPRGQVLLALAGLEEGRRQRAIWRERHKAANHSFRKARDWVGVADTWASLGNFEREWGDPLSAYEAWELAMEGYKILGMSFQAETMRECIRDAPLRAARKVSFPWGPSGLLEDFAEGVFVDWFRRLVGRSK